MQINIKGGSRSQKKHSRGLVKFCANHMMPRMKNIEVNIHIKDFGKDDSLGYAIPSDHADIHRPREFDIELHSKQSLRKFLITLAHEMVHVKQFARSELYESTVVDKHRWRGEWLNKDPEYWDQPWEVEAHGKELGLYVRYCEANKLGKQKWTQDKS